MRRIYGHRYYSQQLFTRMVDEQASSVLQDVGGRGAAGDRPMSAD